MDTNLPNLDYNKDALSGISQKVMEWHHDVHHQGYVNGLKSAEKQLQQQRESSDFTETGRLLDSFTHNYAGHVLHSIFWKNMTQENTELEGKLLEKIEEDFGSVENWEEEFKQAALSASGWALLVYIPREDELHNVAVDEHDEGAVWGAHPVLALDVWEHSYYHDYGPEREKFIDNFMELIDWDDCQERFNNVSSIEIQ